MAKKDEEPKKGSLKVTEAAFIVMIILVLAGVGYIARNIIRERNQDAAMDELKKYVKKIEDYDYEKDKGGKKAEEMASNIEALTEKVYDPEKKALILAYKGVILGKADKYDKAKIEFEKAIASYHRNYLPHLEYARLHHKNKKYEDAIVSINNANSFIPKGKYQEKLDIYYILGTSMDNLRDWARCEKAYEDMLKLAKTRGIETKRTKWVRERLKRLLRE